MEPDENNPLNANVVAQMLEKVFQGKDAVVMVIPDIKGVYYGRGVGYDVEELEPPDKICRVSATRIRKMIRAGDDGWKEMIHPSIIDTLKEELCR